MYIPSVIHNLIGVPTSAIFFCAELKPVLSGNPSMHTGQCGVKGGNKPQSTPHPSYAHKTSVSSSSPSLPPSVPPLLFHLSSSPALSYTIEINRLTLHRFVFFFLPSTEVPSGKFTCKGFLLITSSIFLLIETQDRSVKH